ncbi:hypothetical protein [Gilvimarinus polysaccharolyticus]|uniref:hypothetical protein n=1 Tax=Gilvimarinus polysaccharolyticus TaxID=863921 RepID=UPI000673921D|nr:hypothetical protein [Gilvimarinus polysaccharolyticus]
MNHGCCTQTFLVVVLFFLTACGGDDNNTDAEISQVLISAVVEGQGSVAPSEHLAMEGDEVEFSLHAEAGYKVASVTGCDGSLASSANNESTYTIAPVKEGCNFTVAFEAKTIIKPSLNVTYQANKKQEFSWASTGNAYYRLIEQTAMGDELVLANNIPWDETRFERSHLIPAHIGSSYQVQSCTAQDCALSEWVVADGEAVDSVHTLAQPSKKDFLSLALGQVLHVNKDASRIFAVASYISDAFIDYQPSDLIVYGGVEKELGGVEQVIPFARVVNFLVSEDEKNLFVLLAPSLSTSTDEWAVEWYKVFDDSWQLHKDLRGFVEGRIKNIALSGDGNILTVAHYLNDADSAEVVEIFQVDDELTSLGVITPEIGDVDDAYGSKMALSYSGDIIVVGAPGEDSALNDGLSEPNNNDLNQSGAVYVFSKKNDVWQQQAFLKALMPDGRWSDCYDNYCNDSDQPELSSGDGFGCSVDVNATGDVIAVGACEEQRGQGAVHLYHLDVGGSWVHQQRLQLAYADSKLWLSPSDYEGGDQFGYSLDLSDSGQQLIVGAPYEESVAVGFNGDESDNALKNAGAAVYFQQIDHVWQQVTYIKPPQGAEGSFFGYAVSLNEGENATLVVSNTKGIYVY